MQIVHAGAMEWGENLAAHRQGTMAHKVLFEGEEGSPDNFILALAKEGADYFSPRHRHAWDQVRYCLEGSLPLGNDITLDAGDVAYFPEGVSYGPQENGTDRIVLVLQVGGVTAQGFLSAAQMRRAREELSEKGAFEGGVYRRKNGKNGKGKKNEDAYEAIWRHVTDKPLAYPEPRYKTPIVMRAANFAWGQAVAGVKKKFVGFFVDRCLALDFVSIAEAATWEVTPSGSHVLLFVRAGEGCLGGEPYLAETAVRLEGDEVVTFTATKNTEMFVITLAPVAAL
jgi:hypothetical protein